MPSRIASVVASSVLSHAGFSDVSDLKGGFTAWTAAGLPIATRASVPPVAVEVTPIAAEDLVTAGAAVIDVREPDEWSGGHAPSARLIPLGKVESRLDALRTQDASLIVCRSGGRSNAVTQMLNARGIKAVNLAGGMQAWEQAGLPVVTEAEKRGRIICRLDHPCERQPREVPAAFSCPALTTWLETCRLADVVSALPS